MRKRKGSHLVNAKHRADDEYYTPMSLIEDELSYYDKTYFYDKIVYCNCDDWRWSNFYKFFKNNFHEYKLKKLIATHYCKLWWSNDENEVAHEVIYDGKNEQVTILHNQDGSFSSAHSIKLLKECDIVATNPPFSIIRRHMGLIMKYNKDFLTVAPLHAVGFKTMVKHIKDKKIKAGKNGGSLDYIIIKDGKEAIKGVPSLFLTNLPNHIVRTGIIKKSQQRLFNEDEYDYYTNFPAAIEISYLKDVPINYAGIMGVPVSYIPFHDENEFEILGSDNCLAGFQLFVGREKAFKRLFIRRRKDDLPPNAVYPKKEYTMKEDLIKEFFIEK